jgi:prepilin-type N-terminal cleavage/methylation domain-containing protein
MPTHADISRDDAGFTLVELLVAITISMIVLLATLQSFDLFAATTAQQTRVTDANSQVRATMDDTVNDLRGASKILRADPTDLVYAVPDTGVTRVQRLCVFSDDLYASRTTTSGTAVAPTAACSAGTKLATLKSSTDTAFTYDGASTSATPSLVKNVGLTLSLVATGGGKTTTSTLRASANRRSAGTMQLTDQDLDTTCNDTGALLSLSASIPGTTGTVSVTYADDGGIAIGTPVTGGVQIPKTVTRVVATVTDSVGVTNTITKDLECSGT